MKSTAELAAEQATFWNDAGARMWLGAWQRIERTVTPFGDSALAVAAARPGEKVLDVGCGTGVTTAQLARAVAPDGEVLGVDISQPFIEVANEQKIAHARFLVADAATLELPAGSLDLVFSRFGVMFFGDSVAAFRTFHRLLKPGGRLVFVCWRTAPENHWMSLPVRVATPHLAPFTRPGPDEPGPMSFGNPERVQRILKEAGFAPPTLRAVDRPNWLGKDVAEAVDSLPKFGALARPFAESTPEQAAKAREALAEALAPFAGVDGVLLHGACWVVRTVKPD